MVRYEESDIREMFTCYMDALESINDCVSGIIEYLTGKSRSLRYNQMVRLTRQAIEYYNETLRHNEQTALEEWQNSEDSFSNRMHELGAGEDAINVGRMMESEIIDAISSQRQADSTQLDGIDSTYWYGDVSDFEEVTDRLGRFADDLDDIRSQYAGRINVKEDENTIYSAIRPVVLRTFAVVEYGFRNSIKSCYEELAEEFKNREIKMKNRREAVTQEASASAERIVSDGINDLLNNVKKIWD